MLCVLFSLRGYEYEFSLMKSSLNFAVVTIISNISVAQCIINLRLPEIFKIRYVALLHFYWTVMF